jgi:hypothetical protein
MTKRLERIEWVKRSIGLDRSIAFTVAARLCQIAGSAGTVLLIVRFLSPLEQGYYYTLLSLMALQTVFELGFSFVILQLAAHESALLTIFPDGRIEGERTAHARLASVLRLTLRWYLRAAIAFAVVVLPLGIFFFSREAHGADHVSWLGPWIAAVLATSVTFFLTPLCSFLEGCNQVRPVARLRMVQALIVVVLSWGAIAAGRGLYACALVNLGWIAVCMVFFARRRRILFSLLRHTAGEDQVSWRDEIWPFQWKIAVSWFCSYCTMQMFTPILFVFRSPQEAGRMGLSLSIAGYLPILALCWITPKAAPFGQLVKRGLLAELDAIFFKTLKQATALMLLLVAVCFVAVLGVQTVSPKMAQRMVAPSIFALLLCAAFSSFLVQSMAVYLRSFKREPYLVQSMVVAGLTVAGILLTVSRWGSLAVAVLYCAVSGAVGLPWAAVIFHAQRKVWRGNCHSLAEMSEAVFPVAPVGGVVGVVLEACGWEGDAK